MPTKAELEADNKTLRDTLGAIQSSLESLGQIGQVRRVSVKDTSGYFHLIEPNRVMQIVPGVSKVINPQIPGSVIDSSIVLFNFSNDGRLGNVILPGKPEDVAKALGIEYQRVDLPTPTQRIIVTNAAEATAAIAAVQTAGPVPVNP